MTMSPARLCTRFAALLFAALLPGQEPKPAADPVPAGDRLLVANKAAHTLSIFAVGERKEVATLPTGRGPHEVAVSPDGRTAVVTDYGDQKPGQTLTVVDVVKGEVVRTIDLSQQETTPEGTQTKTFLRPHGVQFTADDRVVVTSEQARRLLLVDVAKGAIVRTWVTPQTLMHMVALSKDRRRAAASSLREGNVAFFALDGDAAGALPATACGEQSEGLAVHPRTGDAWVGNRAADTLTIVAAADGAVKATLATGDFPFRVAFTPDGAQALVTCAESGELQVFDGNTHALVREVSIHGDTSEQSAMPMGITTDPDGRRAYVTCGRGEFVAVIELATGTVIDRLKCGKGADGIAYARPAAGPPIKR